MKNRTKIITKKRKTIVKNNPCSIIIKIQRNGEREREREREIERALFLLPRIYIYAQEQL